MLPRTVLFALIVHTTCLFIFAGQPDPRFEGYWADVENFQAAANRFQKGQNLSRPTLLAIGKSGESLAIVRGIQAGRFEIMKESNGNTLMFSTPRATAKGIGRGSKLVLSADGNTLTEKGQAVVTDPPYGLLEYTDDQLEKLKSGKGSAPWVVNSTSRRGP